MAQAEIWKGWGSFTMASPWSYLFGPYSGCLGSSMMALHQETKYLVCLGKNKEVLGWTIWDIRGNGLIIVQYRIYLKDNVKPFLDQ